MVLTDRTIKKDILEGKIEITPFNEDNLNPNSYDLTLNKTCKVYSRNAISNAFVNNEIYDKYMNFDTLDYCILDCKEKPNTFEFDILKTGFTLKPNHLYLFSCNEKLSITGDVCATLQRKSSLGRLGLDIHVCAGFMDTGFYGSLVLELRTIYPLIIYPDMKICQIKFERTEGYPDECYRSKKGSKYVGQEGPQESLMHKNFQ